MDKKGMKCAICNADIPEKNFSKSYGLNMITPISSSVIELDYKLLLFFFTPNISLSLKMKIYRELI